MKSSGERGLTLVEMLVVLAIIGVVGTAAVLGLGGASRGASVQAEAQRLASAIQLAADGSLVRGGGFAVDWNERGYSLQQLGTAGKQTAPAPESEVHELPGDMRLSSDRDESPVAITEVGAAKPVSFTFTGSTGIWHVEFDGVTAAATPGGSG